MSRDTFTVVVGFSSVRSSASALTWAVDEAGGRGGRVVAVRAWRPSPPGSTGMRPPLQTYVPEEDQAQQADRLAREVEDVVGAGAPVVCRLVHGGRRKTLLAEASAADLLVVGAPRRLRPSDGLGFAHRLLYATSCPVVVMPPQPRGQGAASARMAAVTRRVGEEIVRAAGESGRPGVRAPHVPDPDAEPR
jgi:nucleotide-binding universal stress UspA family protein